MSKKTIADFKREENSESQSIKSIFLAIYTNWLVVFVMIFSLSYFLPVTANASIFSAISDFFAGNPNNTQIIDTETNSQNVPLLTGTVNFDSNAAVGGGDINTADDGEALIADSGPSGTSADIEDSISTGQISKYTVRKGDTLSSIAKMYGVTTNTIIWANDIGSAGIKEGQTLVILPVSGTLHTVIKGDTLKSIAKKYKGDVGEISQFNGLESDSVLALGDTIVIPDGEGIVRVSGTIKSSSANPYRGGSGPELAGYYIRPISGGIKTQGIHGYNAVDIGIPTGSTLYAAASGQVIVARSSGWNGGYGKYVVISHNNGTQTVYGHMSAVNVNVGDFVYQGQIIGLTGNTGHSTGPHLHFEVRGAKNPLN